MPFIRRLKKRTITPSGPDNWFKVSDGSGGYSGFIASGDKFIVVAP